jgi:hypothetical protein
MPIRPLLEAEGEAFGPEDVQALVSAFEAALEALRLVDRRDPAVLMVARRVIALAKEGSRDAIVLRDRVVSAFRNGVGSGH